MNEQVIIFRDNSGGVGIINPSPRELAQRTIHQIGVKDVPRKSPFKIINKSELPKDSTFRDAWEADFSNPDGYGV